MAMINYDLNKTNISTNQFPHIFRCLIIGFSGAGKTNLLLNLLMNQDMSLFNYQKVYIYSKTLYQDKYQILIKFFRDIEKELGTDILKCFENEEDIILPNEIDSKYKNIFVFDDILLDHQGIVEKYFAQGRNNNVSCFYLCQSYSKIKKQVIRDNANVLIMFNTDEKNMKHVYSNHIFHVIPTFNDFKNLCLGYWQNEPNKFFVYNKESNLFFTNLNPKHKILKHKKPQ
jgi:Poxvirus A32 protein